MKTSQLNSLFNQFCNINELPNYGELKTTKGIKSLKLDFNSVYGGYRIDIVNEDTSEGFYNSSARVQKKIMVAYLQGFIDGYKIIK